MASEYATLTAALLALLAAYLAPKPGLPWPEWAQSRMAILTRFRVEVLRELSRTSAVTAVLVERAMSSITTRAAAAAAVDTRFQGPLPDVSPDAVRAVTEALEAAHARIPAVLEDTYYRAVNAARTAIGDPTPEIQRRLDELAQRGITGYTDRSGRRWSLETYVETTTRAHYAEAAISAYLEVAQRAGVRFVQVSWSYTECPRCTPWKGTTLSIDGSPRGTYWVGGRPVVVAGSLTEAREAGLLHPWCRHRITVVTGRRIRMGGRGPNDRVARAEARYRHRTARAWERRRLVALTTQAKTSAASRVARWRNNQRNR